MPDNRYRVKRGDRPGFLRGTCRDENGVVRLHEASEARLLIRRRAESRSNPGPLKVSAPVTILDTPDGAAPGRWEYRWGATDLDTAGVYSVELQVTWPAGERLTFPTHGYNELIIEDDLG